MFGKKKRQHATADLSEQAMNDSLRAAQVIFQRHTGSQASLSSGSVGTVNQAASQPRVIKSSHGTLVPRSTHHGVARSSQNGARSALSSAASNHSGHQQLSRPVSPLPSGSAHAAAAMAHMALSKELDPQQEELLALSALSQTPRSTSSSGKNAQDAARSNVESSENHSGGRERPPTSRHTVTPSSSAASSIPKQAVSQAPSISHSHLDVRHLPNRPQPAHSAYALNTPSSTLTGNTAKLKKSESRTLVGRIPPPNIYLETANTDYVEQDQESEDKEEDAVSFNLSSTASSSSALSFVSGGASDGDDEGDLYSQEQDLKSDIGDYVGNESESFDYRSSNDVPGQTFSAVSLASESDETKSSTTPVQTNATYSTLNRIGHGNVTYQGTLPDLIPNHTRRTKIDRIKTKLFGSKSRSDGSNDQGLSRSSVTADEEGRPVVTTNHNLRFKTTMRGHGRHSSIDSGNADDANGAQIDGTITAEGVLMDSDDDDSDSIENRGDDRKRQRRTTRLKRRLKHTTVPYTHHLHHHEIRHHVNRKGFNEDKPWKSHKDVGFVTPPERKRYEGMWVSNRCLYLKLLPWWASVISGQSTPPVKLPEDGLILNLVVKDIWARSNLPNDLLRQIYEKVDTRKDGTLDRKSFIVGMWLVDQCLYGRKLPKEISQQVWDSVDRYVVNVVNSTAMKHLGKSKKKLMKQEIKNIKKDIKNVHL